MKKKFFVLLLLIAASVSSAQGEELTGVWQSNYTVGQKTIEFSKSGNFTITLRDISDTPEEQKFKDEVQSGTWRLSSGNTNNSRIGSTFGKQNRVVLKFSTGQGDKIQGYKFRFFTLNGSRALELNGPGLVASLGDELGILPKPDSNTLLAESAGGYYLRQ